MKGKNIIRAIFCAVIIAAFCSIPMPAYAAKNGIVYDSKGHIFIYKNGKKQTGWVKYKGETYYCHKTGTKKYPKGSATRGEMKVRTGNRWYAFAGSGKLIKPDKDGEYKIRKGARKWVTSLIMNKDGTVRYVMSIAACFRGYRFSTAARRDQHSINDKWTNISERYYPDYVDHQK